MCQSDLWGGLSYVLRIPDKTEKNDLRGRLLVSHPIRSLAQAYVYREQCQPFGIYADGKMVGYVMVIYDYDVPEYDIWHMMIDESMQGRGYGSAALDRVLDYVRTKPRLNWF